LTNFQAVSVQIGSLCFTLLSQKLFNDYNSFRVPFLTITLSDAVISIICILFSIFGLITNKDNTKSNEEIQIPGENDDKLLLAEEDTNENRE